MDLNRASVTIRRRDSLELADLALAYVFHLTPEVFARLFVATLLPAWVALAVVTSRWSIPVWATWCVAIAWGTALRGVFTLAAARVLFDGRVRARTIGMQFARKLPTLVASSVASTAVFAVLLPTGLGAAYFAARCQFGVEAVALENARPLAAVRRSFAMTRGRVLSTLVTSSLALLIQVAFAVSVALLIHGVRVYVLMLPPPSHGIFEIGQSLSAIFGYFVSLPFLSAYRFLTYVDSRVRADGWDLQLRFKALAAAQQEAAGA